MSDIPLSQKKKKERKKKVQKTRRGGSTEVSRAGFSANQAKTLNTREETRARSFDKFSHAYNKAGEKKEKKKNRKSLS